MIEVDTEAVPSLQIGARRYSRKSPTLMIAEEGQANDGDFELALKMIQLAADCGADGIEFQLSVASDLYVLSHEGYQIYRKREFSPVMIGELAAAAHSRNILFHAACVSDDLVDAVVSYGADVVVVNAMDLNNPRMLDAAATCGKPFLIATLMATIEEIDWAVSHVRARGADNFAILHGQHIMTSQAGNTVPLEYLQLDCIGMLERRYGVPVGFVDHTNTEIVPALAASRGAMMVTKHLSPTVDWQGADWEVCLHPEAWRRANQYLSDANLASGADKTLSIEELGDRAQMRRSIVAKRNIPSGKLLEESDICFKRPGGGLDPREFQKYLGKRVKTAVEAEELIAESMFES